MLNKELVVNTMKDAKQRKYMLTFFTYHRNGTAKNRYSGLPCYGSVINFMRTEKFFETDGLAVFPLKKNTSRHTLFVPDSPFTKLLDMVYEHSYKDFFTPRQFKQFVVDNGIILEPDLIKDWCPASFMALVMAIRDIHGGSKPTFHNGTLYNDSFFPNLPKPVQRLTDRKVEPIYSAVPNNIMEVRHFYYVPFLTKSISSEGLLGWTSGTDTAQWVVSGYALASDPKYTSFIMRFRNERDTFYWKTGAKFNSTLTLDEEFSKTEAYEEIIKEFFGGA